MDKRNPRELCGFWSMNIVGDSVIYLRGYLSDLRGSLRRTACLGDRLRASRKWILFWTCLEISRRMLYKWFWSWRRELGGDIGGGQKVPLGFSVIQYRKTRTNFLANPIQQWEVSRGTARERQKGWMRSSKESVHRKAKVGCQQTPEDSTASQSPSVRCFLHALALNWHWSCPVIVLWLSVPRALWAASGTVLLRGTSFSVCCLSKLFSHLLIIFRHEKLWLPSSGFHVMKIHIHLERECFRQQIFIWSHSIMPSAPSLLWEERLSPRFWRPLFRVLQSLEHSNHKKRQIKNGWMCCTGCLAVKDIYEEKRAKGRGKCHC